MASADDLKQAVGRAAVDRYVVDGMRLGLGTGSTAIWAVRRIAERFAAGELPRLRVVTTSLQSDLEARALGLPVVTLNDAGMEEGLDLTIDGADEVDARGLLIKGGGGALLMEKVVAYASKRFVVVVDRGKLSDRLGTQLRRAGRGGAGRARPGAPRDPGARAPRSSLRIGGAEGRARGDGPRQPAARRALSRRRSTRSAMEAALDAIPGVLGNGLFTRRRPEVLVGRPGRHRDAGSSEASDAALSMAIFFPVRASRTVHSPSVLSQRRTNSRLSVSTRISPSLQMR